MRHGRSRGRLGLVQEHRRALLRNLARGLIAHQQIVTTHDRAKETSRFVDRLVTIAKEPSLHSRRELIRKLGSGSEELAKRLLETVAPKFSERNGGYTRVLRYKDRAGDGAALSLLEFSAPIEIIPKKVKKKKTAKPSVKEEPKEKTGKPEARPAPGKEESKTEAPKKGGFLSSLRRFFLGGDHEKK